MDNIKIANFIKTKRKEKKLTQGDLANKLNVTEKAISRWETGRGTPDISLLIPLASELNVSVSSILRGEESTNINDNVNEVLEYMNESKKMNKLPLTISIIFYILALIEFVCFLKIEYNPNTEWDFIAYIFIFILIGVTVLIPYILLNNYYIDKKSDKTKIKKISLTILFVYYFVVVLNLLVFNRNNNVDITMYNFIPFKSLYESIFESANLKHNLFLIVFNLLIFMPFEYILINLFDVKEWKQNFIISIIVVSLIEILQLLFKSGVCDIDDVLICVLGMMIYYFSYNYYEKIINLKN